MEPPKAFWQVIEYLPGGTLANWLRGERRTVSERLNMAIGIAKGMQASQPCLKQIADIFIMIGI